MGSGKSETGDRRHRTRDMVERLLAERQQMFVLYNRVAGIEPWSEDKPSVSSLNEFCEILVDYTASGHFGLYQRILDGRERRRSVSELAENLYPRIAGTTQASVEFNDKYDGVSGEEDMEHLATDLSRLGEQLATRAELEDRLIDAMLGAADAER